MNLPPKLFAKYAKDPTQFRASLNIDISGTVQRWGDCMDDWQREDFAAIDPGLMYANGQSTEPGINRVYLERPRGHSKTSDCAAVCLYLLVFATRPVKGFFFAVDKEQAKLPKEQMATLIRLNPWLSDIVEVQANRIINIGKGHPGNGSFVEIQTSDVASSYGLLADFLLCEEITHWQGDGSLFHSVLSTAAKRENCLLMLIGNAGFCETWQWQVREAARMDDNWHFSRLNGPVASWLTEKQLDEQRRMLPAIAYSRLWENNWSTGGGDCFAPEVIDRAFLPDLAPMTGPDSDYLFCAGVDLGLSRDCASVVVLAVPSGGRAGKIRLASHKLWRPTLGAKINLLDIEAHIVELDNRFGLEFCAFDPWQAEHMAQTIEADLNRKRRSQRFFVGEPFMREVAPTATNLRQQATLTIEFFNDRRIQLYDCEPLRRDLHKLRVEEKSYGVRLVSPRDGEGHGDSFSAFALALLVAHELAGRPTYLISTIDRQADNSDPFAARLAAWEADQRMFAEPERDSGFLDALRAGQVTFSRDMIR